MSVIGEYYFGNVTNKITVISCTFFVFEQCGGQAHKVYEKTTFYGCNFAKYSPIFTARCYASAVLAMSLCPSVSVSVTSRSSTKMVKMVNDHTNNTTR